MDLFRTLADAITRSGFLPRRREVSPKGRVARAVAVSPPKSAVATADPKEVQSISRKGKLLTGGADPVEQWSSLLSQTVSQRGRTAPKQDHIWLWSFLIKEQKNLASSNLVPRRSLLASLQGALSPKKAVISEAKPTKSSRLFASLSEPAPPKKQYISDRLPLSLARDVLVNKLAWKQTREAFPLVMFKVQVAKQLQQILRMATCCCHSMQRSMTFLGRAANMYYNSGASKEVLFLNLKYTNSEALYLGKILQSVATKLRIMRELDGMILQTALGVDPGRALSTEDFLSLERNVPGFKSLRSFTSGATFASQVHPDVIRDLATGQGTFRAGILTITHGLKMLRGALSEASRGFRLFRKAGLKLPKGVERETRQEIRRIDYFANNVAREMGEVQDGLAARELKKVGVNFDSVNLDQFDFQHEGLHSVISGLLFGDL